MKALLRSFKLFFSNYQSTHSQLDWASGKIPSLKEWSGTSTGCPGQCWSHHCWECSDNVWLGHLGTWFGGDRVMAGLDDLRKLFQPKEFHDSVTPSPDSSRAVPTVGQSLPWLLCPWMWQCLTRQSPEPGAGLDRGGFLLGVPELRKTKINQSWEPLTMQRATQSQLPGWFAPTWSSTQTPQCSLPAQAGPPQPWHRHCLAPKWGSNLIPGS